MSVKFTPGPHPTSRSSSAVFLPSSTHSPAQLPQPQSQSQSQSQPLPESPSPSSPIRFSARRAPDVSSPSDLERQPLLPPQQLNRGKTFYPIVVAVLVLIVLGVVVFGGWRLGKGEGGGRWPGGPH
ncbi:hypothetical protein IAR55_004923 [Kwoniella newhampshirensis]|uniref:Uncharacterized protein n=1 Tax=Kwoniella newhampshirensis TaxID=1651941 RepID=A0AAW0YWA9_9TREE